MSIKKLLKKILYFVKGVPKLIHTVPVKQTVIVLGMHRSGTSLAANVLHEAGVNMGKALQGSTVHNKKGHYENLVIKDLNKSILKACDASWDEPPTSKSLKENEKKFLGLVRRIVQIEQDVQWGWKDPRTVFTIDYFFPFLINPKIIVCRRDFNDVAESLRVRNNFETQKGLDLAKKYNDQIDQFLKTTQCPYIEIMFTDWFENSFQTIQKINDFLELDLSDKQIKQLIEIFDPSVSTTMSIK